IALAVILVAAVLFTLTLARPGLSTRIFADDETSAATTASQGADASALPSASTVSGTDFLVALDAYVAANPTADEGDYVEINDNTPSFTVDNATTDAFQSFSQLDRLGRCGTAYACLGPETLPTDARGDISEIHPSGWVQNFYDFIENESLYNRSHLIAHCLSGQNANERNLITGTRHFNADVMEPIEAMVLNYIEQTGNHVLYRVTPVFEGDELVARGVQIEALSMEDGGQGVSLNVFLRNVQPGVTIDYATGNNWADEAATDSGLGTGSTATDNRNASAAGGAAATGLSMPTAADAAALPTISTASTNDQSADSQTETPSTVTYVVNKKAGKFHYPSCSSVPKIKTKNRMDSDQTRDELIAQGYVPCKDCNP
ncbi:MAG: DNA/RNA non-specific endonuclease, partial [Coriobacteriaceae bacterium]|nr:DNA/RNA non-specific endonuclease [Coriobacteriaceae bacterium]